MTEDTAAGGQPAAPPRTFAGKLNWLIEQAHPPGRGAFSNAEVAALVGQATGVKISYGAVWELRTGRTVNPTKRVIEALAQTFGVPAGFFFDDYGDEQVRLLAGQAELLAMIQDADVDHAQLRAFIGLPPEARQAMTGIIDYTARTGKSARTRNRDQRRPRQ